MCGESSWKSKMRPLLVDAGMPSARRCGKASKEKIGKRGRNLTQIRVGLWGKEAAGGSKSKSCVGHESSQRQGEDFYDPARKDNILRRNKTRLELWEEHLKAPKCLESQY